MERCGKFEGRFNVLIVGWVVVLVMLDDVSFGFVFGLLETILPLFGGGPVPKGIQVALRQ